MMDLVGFQELRPYLFSVAYRMLGRASEAEDVIQDAWVRYQTASPETIESLKAYLTTIVTRLCLDRLKSASANREEYHGPWLPEPILTEGPSNPEERLARYESITMGFLVLLETLTPPERAVFLLREVFDYDYDVIASMLDTTDVNCRQLLSRAKARIAEGRPRFTGESDSQKRLVEAFIGSMQRGDAGELASMLADDVAFWADGGGKVTAAGRPLFGRDSVLKLLLGIRRGATTLGVNLSMNVTHVNGELAVVVSARGGVDSVYVLSIADDKINAFHVVRNPDKLQYLKDQLRD
jgi:RNA polymerase sigma-70 factor (ECF subfamily)